MTFNSVRNVIVVAASLSILSLPMSAQSSYGSIVGTVTDATGATVPGAAVTATNLGTSERRAAESDESGNYQFVNLLPGNYRVDIEKSGFKHVTSDQVQVVVLSSSRVDASLQVGEVGQTVEVTSQAALLQTENASVGQVVEGRVVLEMPLNGRNVINLIELAPGVVAHSGSQGQVSRSGFSNFQISGGMIGQGRTILDGVAMNTGLFNGVSFLPAQDMVQEFQVMTNNLPPEFGSTMNGVINLATKSGSNQFHGSLYEFLRNRALNASTFFSNRAGLGKPAFTQNQYGFTLGGPIVKDRTFFFGAYEVFTQRVGTTTTNSVPTAALRGGDFSNLRSASGALITIYDPATTCGQFGNPACATGQALRSPFPANRIPATRFDKTAVYMQKFWPMPNAAGVPFTNANNYIVNYNAINDRNWENGRIDHNVSSKQRLFGRFSRYDNILPPVDPLGVNAGFYQTQGSKQGMLADTYTLSPTIVLDGRMSFARTEFTRTPVDYPIDYTALGWPASFNQQILQQARPTMAVNGFSNTGNGGLVNRQYSGVGYLAGSVTMIAGKHTIKFGGEYSWLPTAYGQTSTNTFRFTNLFTSANPLSPGSTGNGFSSYLLGLGASGNAGSILFPMGTQKTGGMYLGDTYKVNNRLTLNLGVRWEFTGYWSERYDQQVVFQTQATNPVLSAAGLKYGGDLVLVNSDRYKYRTSQIPHWDLFSPRLGAAYRVNEKTVVRSGFGISYTPGVSVMQVIPYVSPINSAVTPWVPTQDNGLTPLNVLSNPFPNGILVPPGRNPSYARSLLGTGIIAPLPDDATPYVMNWNFNIERQVGTTHLIDIAYVGVRAVHMRMGGGPANGPNFNQLPNQYLSLGSQLLTPVANPFFGIVQTGSLSSRTIPYGQTLLPYPQYNAVQSPTTAGFNSAYHGLQAKYQKRFQAGGTFMINYTWSKNTGNAETLIAHTEDYTKPGLPQDFNNWGKAEHSLISYDVPHRVSASYVLDLPVGKGKRFLSGVSGVTDKLVSGWGMNGVLSLQSGFPMALFAQPTALSQNFNAGTPRPNVVAGCNKIPEGSAQSRLNQWFNTSCFSQPSTFGFGSEGRVDPNIRTAGVNNFNFALFKNTSITERVVLQFRAEVFNSANRVQFAGPGATLGTPQFGVVSVQTNDPRLIQFGLRLTF